MRQLGGGARWMLVLMLMCAVGSAQAQGYPSRPIRVIIPYAVNGAADVVARAAVQGIEQTLGQPVLLDNRPGKGGTLGTGLAAAAAPDGYTLLMGTTSTMVVIPSAEPKLDYDPMRNFTPVGLVAIVPSVLIVHQSVRANSLTELLALLRSRPGAFNYGSPGPGSWSHLTTELFKSAAGVEVAHVPYKGNYAAAIADLRQGLISMMFVPTPFALANARAGELRLLGVTSRERVDGLAAPTMTEAGLPGFDASFWYALFAPAGTPPDIVTRLNAQLNSTLALSQVNATMVKMGGKASPGSPQEMAGMLAADLQKWGPLIKALNIRTD